MPAAHLAPWRRVDSQNSTSLAIVAGLVNNTAVVASAADARARGARYLAALACVANQTKSMTVGALHENLISRYLPTRGHAL